MLDSFFMLGGGLVFLGLVALIDPILSDGAAVETHCTR